MTQPTPHREPLPGPNPVSALRTNYFPSLAGTLTTLAERLTEAAGRPEHRGPAAEVLPTAIRLLQLAADAVGLLIPFTDRCDLALARFTGEWLPCGPDLTAGTIHPPTGPALTGCLEHLSIAYGLNLGVITEPLTRVRVDQLIDHRAPVDRQYLTGQESRSRYHAILANLTQPPTSTGGPWARPDTDAGPDAGPQPGPDRPPT